ncbi:ABC transporter ATP-binding protein [Saccharibacillus sacchari]|uniref:ABC-type multidrug transport system, ATPase and permease component n=1 Tax=Saccharibacillus sacchari DSM 19268 TaxID=915437 RepID=A0A010Z7P3_9BACL|nr:ABC transporter ATP-binding protein [Saccharibacillus sacchari]EXG83273.1 ABC-type multidrug transport system, ATPase and permease component [Saccharibacillus sacchari DSM 19268]
MWRLGKYLKPYWLPALLAPLFMVLEVCMDLMQPKLLQRIVDDGIAAGDGGEIQRTGLLMLGVALLGVIGGVGCTIYSSIASQNFGRDLRGSLFGKVQSLSFRNLDNLPTGTLITRITNDVTQLQTFVQMLLRMFVRSPMLIVGSLIMAVTINAKLTLILAVSVPLLFVFLFFLVRFSLPMFADVQKRLDSVNGRLQENLNGIRVVKAFVRSDYEEERFGEVNRDYTSVMTRGMRIMALNMPIMTLILNISIIAVLWYGGALNRSGDLAVGELVAYINYVTQMLSSMLSIGMILTFISRAKASADRVNEVFDERPDIENPVDSHQASQTGGRVDFEHVSFGYGKEKGELALRDISFTVLPGQTLGILGATGSGKTSLISLIPRLYDPRSGEVRVDGAPVSELELSSLREKVGVVLQEANLFSGSIADNIRFGRPEATDAEVERAAQSAQAHEFIERMPDGYATKLGQKGINLSGGQKQRIAIARALLMRPAVLILDDSTSAVDLTTESKIRSALEREMSGTTKLIIAQRISAVQGADLILVMDRGAVAAIGTHNELIQDSEIYREIYRSQVSEGSEVYA